LPHECSFLRIEPENLVLSAFKKADARDSIIVRIYNTTEKDTQGCLKFFRPISHVFSTDLNENRKGELSIYSGNEVHFPISGFRIMTFEVEYALRA
jgi:alpha-mannosidase